MAKIKFEDLCQRLQENNERKWSYFKELDDPRFLEPFSKTDILNFNDQAAPQVIKYLERVLDTATKDIIINIINRNFEQEVDYSWGTYLAILSLINKLDLINDVEEKIVNYKILFNGNNSIKFCEILLNNEAILKTKELYKECILNIINYEIQIDDIFPEKEKIPKSIHDQYLLNELIHKEPMHTTFAKIVSRDDIFQLLKNTYEEIIKETSDLRSFNRQFIKSLDEDEDDERYDRDDSRHIILDCLAISLKYSQEDNTKKIEELLNSESLMLKKAGLYAIGLDYKKYNTILFNFLKNIKDNENKIEIISNCRFEIITLFEDISKPLDKLIDSNMSNNEVINAELQSIQEFLNSFKEEELWLKYRLMHGLKNHSYFGPEFNSLKAKKFNGREDTFAKLDFISSGGAKQVIDKSPIDKEEFKKKNKDEQINFLNTYDKSKFKNSPWNEENGNYIEINDNGLAKMFKEVLLEDYEKYTNSSKIKNINNPKIYWAIFEAMKEKLTNKESIEECSIEKSLELIDFFLNKDINLENSFNEFGFALNTLISTIIDESTEEEQYNLIYKVIKKINSLNQNEALLNNLASDAINHNSGRNWENFIRLILKEQKLSDGQLELLNFQLSKDNLNYTDKLFLYHFGFYIDYLVSNIKDNDFYEVIEKFDIEQTSPFLIGFSMGNRYIDTFKKVKNTILNAFKDNLLSEAERERFVKKIAIAKFEFNEDDLFNEFEAHFDNNDKKNIISLLSRKDKIEKIDRNKVFEYWKKIVGESFAYPEKLLTLFISYKQNDDFITYSEEIKNTLELYSNLSTSLNSEYNFSKFLKAFLLDINASDRKEKDINVFNIMYRAIEATSKYNYLHNTPEILREILLEFQKREEDVKTLANKICNTPGLIQYSNLFAEFTK